MEHRFAARCHLPLAVALYARDSMVARGVCRDVGAEGMFVRMRPCHLHRNSIVEVEILAIGLRLRALVVHCGEEGAGLVFEDTKAAQGMVLLQRYLRRVIRGPGS